MKYLFSIILVLIVGCVRKDGSNVLQDPKWNIEKDQWLIGYLDTAHAYKSYYDEDEFLRWYPKLFVHGYFLPNEIHVYLTDTLGRDILIDSTNLSWKHRINPATIRKIASLYNYIPKSKSYKEKLDSINQKYTPIINKYKKISEDEYVDAETRMIALLKAQRALIDAMKASNQIPIKNY